MYEQCRNRYGNNLNQLDPKKEQYNKFESRRLELFDWCIRYLQKPNLKNDRMMWSLMTKLGKRQRLSYRQFECLVSFLIYEPKFEGKSLSDVVEHFSVLIYGLEEERDLLNKFIEDQRVDFSNVVVLEEGVN